MRMCNANTRAENDAFRQRFAGAGLDLAKVLLAAPDDPELESRQLRGLWDWVCAYRRTPDRAALERQGYAFPPVDPDCDPDSDWLRFERWMRGEPVDWNFVEEYGPLPDPMAMTHSQTAAELKRVEDLLNARGVCFSFVEGVPARALYVYLKRELENSRFDILAEGSRINITGCTGWCDDCFQRRWCETADELWDDTVAAMAL